MFGSLPIRPSGHSRLAADEAPGLRPQAGSHREAPGPVVRPESGNPRAMVPLTQLEKNAGGIVAGVRLCAPGATGGPDAALERVALRLMEMGFVEGERLRVVAFGQPGNEPIGVRIGGRGGASTFALRRPEADCVWVWPDR